MQGTKLLAVLSCLMFSAANAEDFVCPDDQSKALDRERWKIDYESGDRASVDLAIDALLDLASRANRPEDRFAFQRACDDIAEVLLVEGLVEEKAASLAGCPEGTVDDVAQRREKRKQVYGEDPLLPIVRVSPRWPGKALKEGLSGEVVFEFTVTKKGEIKEPVVVESTNDIFVKNAMRALKMFKYKPREENGKPVEVQGIRDRIVFNYEKKLLDEKLWDCPR
ncbi:MAG: energy transducer TonB [Woeseiaceae bacterium]|nr:energy transducer TonB [Woeseiaceae bacterium]